MLATKDITKLLESIPKGAWVALSNDQEAVVAYDAELTEAVKKAKAKGENNPVIVRVPEQDSTLIF
jgi:Family of unknown function (DUF5678)